MTGVASTWTDVRSVLHGPFRILAFGRFLDSIGSLLTLSLLVVYLAEVRGLPILTATLVLSWMAVIGLAAVPIVGTLTDRFGPRPVMLVAILIEAVGVFATAFVTTAGQAFAAAALVSLGAAGVWGPAATFTARLVPEVQRPTAFAVGFMLLNLGLGVGGLLGALIVDIDRPHTFQVLYFVDAATYLTFWLAIVALRGHGGPHGDASERESGSWREALRDRRLLGLVAVSLSLTVFGYASMEAGLAIYITAVTGEPESLIGVVFFANTLTIVLAQIFVLGWIRGHSRVRMLGIAAALWGVAWLLLIPAPLIGKLPAALLLVAFGVVFALGESVWSPTVPSLLNAIAPDHLRGRYNSAQSLTWNVGSMIAPIIAGLLIGAGAGIAWVAIIAAGCVVSAVAAQRLRRRLTPAQDGREA